jgi:hypothetical protein
LSEESVFSGVGAGCEGAVGGGDGAGVDEVTGGDGFVMLLRGWDVLEIVG